MLYALFLAISILYNWRKFGKERAVFLESLIEAKNVAHREMILGHHFHVFILEVFLALVVAHLITEKSMAIGMIGLGFCYMLLVLVGFGFYKFFISYLERATGLSLWTSFKHHIIKELRVNFALVLMPILIYSTISWTFSDGVVEEWGNLWFIGLIFNILFMGVLTVACTVILMLRLIPNREIVEPEFLEIINKRLQQIGVPLMRVRWIETDVKNAFVVGLKLFRFSNQTMFIGRGLRDLLTQEEFDAVICHELAHVANRHINKRLINLMKNFITVLVGLGFIMLFTIGFSYLYWGEDLSLHTEATSAWTVLGCLSWIIFNYTLLFDVIRSHEYEADAYAVINLGASATALASSLEKLMSREELPAYLEAKRKKSSDDNLMARILRKYFSTHPQHSERISNLHYKIEHNLPFDHYVSSAQRIQGQLNRLLSWKVAAPISFSFVISFIWMGLSYQKGQKTVAYVSRTTASELMKDRTLVSKINTRPGLIGQSLMYYIVKKGDQELIDYFIAQGADKGRTLVYISQMQNLELLKKYYTRFHEELSDDEYFLVLRMSAQMNFTEGYRYLVNAERFETMNLEYKNDVTRMQRRPASTSNQPGN